MKNYQTLNLALKSAQIEVTATELHGLLSGFICGGLNDNNWEDMLYQLTNDNHAYPKKLMDEVKVQYQIIQQHLANLESFDFQLALDDTSIFSQSDTLAEWVNSFLLGLGIAQPTLDKEQDDIREAIQDLTEIGQLGYTEEDSKNELENALIEIIEYVQTLAMLFYTNFNQERLKQENLQVDKIATTLH